MTQQLPASTPEKTEAENIEHRRVPVSHTNFHICALAITGRVESGRERDSDKRERDTEQKEGPIICRGWETDRERGNMALSLVSECAEHIDF
jgi:hypothetical protein